MGTIATYTASHTKLTIIIYHSMPHKPKPSRCVAVQTDDSKSTSCASRQGADTEERNSDADQQASLEATTKHIQIDLIEAREKIAQLEVENAEQRRSAAHYRAYWINECRLSDTRHANYLAGESADNCPSVSQADWMASSPDRSYGSDDWDNCNNTDTI